MNGKLEEQLALVVEKSIKLAEKTGEFVIDQAPELIRQFYLWHITKSFFFILLGVVVLIIGLLVVKLIGSKSKCGYRSESNIILFKKYYDSDRLFGSVLVSIITLIPFSIFTLGGLYDLLMILVAPKLYLIEYFIK